MNIDPAAIHKLITEQAAAITDNIVAGLRATAAHGRASATTLRLKIAHDKDDPMKIVVFAQQKTKLPQSYNEDATHWTDEDEICSLRVDEEQGQERIGV